MIKKLIIFGAGGFAREVAWLIFDINHLLPADEVWDVVGFVEYSNERVGQSLNGIPIINLSDVGPIFSDTYAIVAIGATSVREQAVNQAKELGLKFATLIHPDVKMDKTSVQIGEGSIICSGHDCVIEDLVTVSPGCHLSGYTTIHYGAYLGTGAVTVEKHTIGSRSVIGAGAVVVKDIPSNVTAVGIPAKPIL
jgi:acetyltransferase-like isoleucine patch superfamily enzyme